jgi:hypothetical protein
MTIEAREGFELLEPEERERLAVPGSCPDAITGPNGPPKVAAAEAGDAAIMGSTATVEVTGSGESAVVTLEQENQEWRVGGFTPAFLTSTTFSKMASTKAGARPAEGSSSSSTSGSGIRARAMATIWRSPPDIVPVT